MTPTPTPPTTIQTGEFNSASRYSKRRETRKPDGSVRQRAGSLSYLHARDKAPIGCVMTTDCPAPTAAWKWSTALSGHAITVNPECSKHFFDDAKSTSKRRTELVKSVIAHEVCHGLYTARGSDVPRICRDVRVPFRLLNLMEDCRIEYKYVIERGKECKFRWRMFDDKMVKAGSAISSPITWLFTMKTREPVLFKSLASVMAPFKWSGDDTVTAAVTSYDHPMKKLEGKTGPTVGLLIAFYKKIISAPTTGDVIPIARYWMDTFGREDAADLPPIIVDTVPSNIDGEPDPGEASGSSSAERTTREADHSALEERAEGDASKIDRAMVMPEKVIHDNTEKFVRQPPRPGFIALLRYCQPD